MGGQDPPYRVAADVADDDLGTGINEVADQAVAYLSHPFDPDQAVLQADRAPGVLDSGPHAVEHPDGGQHGGVAAATVQHRAAGDVAALARHDVHVRAVGADVTGGDVAAAQRLDEPAVRPQQRLGLVLRRVAD